MNTLLIFFAFPIAVIIISVVLQKLLNNPILVAALIFALFLIITFTAFDETFLIATLVYTILAFITAIITKIICNSNNDNSTGNCLNNILSNNTSNNESNCGCTRTSESNYKNDANNSFSYTYNRYRNF